MSEKQAKRRRRLINLAFARQLRIWETNQPPRYFFVKWLKWKKSRPDMCEFEKEWRNFEKEEARK